MPVFRLSQKNFSLWPLYKYYWDIRHGKRLRIVVLIDKFDSDKKKLLRDRMKADDEKIALFSHFFHFRVL